MRDLALVVDVFCSNELEVAVTSGVKLKYAANYNDVVRSGQIVLANEPPLRKGVCIGAHTNNKRQRSSLLGGSLFLLWYAVCQNF